MILEEQNAFFRIQTGLRLRLSHFHDNLSFVHKLHSCHPVNRLLYIREYPGSNAYIYDYKAEKKFFLREGYLYFYPCFREIEIYQEQDLAYRSIHFNVDLFDCGDLFAGSPVRELGGELAEGIAKLPAAPKSIRDCCLFNAVLNHLTAALLENEEEFIWNPILRESKYRDLFRYVPGGVYENGARSVFPQIPGGFRVSAEGVPDSNASESCFGSSSFSKYACKGGCRTIEISE